MVPTPPRVHVCSDAQCAAPALFHARTGLFEPSRRTPDDRDFRAHPGEGRAGAYPDPAGAAADDRHLAVQPESLQLICHVRAPADCAVTLSHSDAAFKV